MKKITSFEIQFLHPEGCLNNINFSIPKGSQIIDILSRRKGYITVIVMGEIDEIEAWSESITLAIFEIGNIVDEKKYKYCATVFSDDRYLSWHIFIKNKRRNK